MSILHSKEYPASRGYEEAWINRTGDVESFYWMMQHENGIERNDKVVLHVETDLARHFSFEPYLMSQLM